MTSLAQTTANSPRDIPSRQSLRPAAASDGDTRGRPIASAVSLRRVAVAVTACLLGVGTAVGQIYDSLDAHPPKWHLDRSDCDARVLSHENVPRGGIDDRACEAITLECGNGTEAIVVYPIEPVLPLDDLTANVLVMSARTGARIGFRVRYPYLADEETRRPLAVYVYGSSYEQAGEFASIGIGMIERELRLKRVAVRREYGAEADLSDPYVDGIVLNAFSGPGKTSLKIDELRVTGLVPVGQRIISAGNASSPGTRLRISADASVADASLIASRAFPRDRVTKILEHNGEPLAWVRALGFDAVLIPGPLDADILREAITARVKLYVPPPSAPDPALEPLLEPVAAWYLGSGQALDARHLEQTAQTSQLLRRWPSRWRRPLVAAPAEKWRAYAALVDAIINDLPIRNRGLPAGEEVAQAAGTRMLVGDRVETGVGIASMPAETMIRQVESIADRVGAARPETFRWHAMWLQAIRSLETTPSAILYRSSRSLATGSEMANRRSMALSYVNRMLTMIEPWLVGAEPTPPPAIVGGPYRCTRLSAGRTDLLLLTSTAIRGTEVLAGDGTSVDILLSPEEATRTVWRLTHFSAERLTPDVTPTGARIQIVSPDAAEVIAISGDPSVGGQLSRSATRVARQAGLDRWQLTSELVRQTRQRWDAAAALRATDRSAPLDLIEVAGRTLAEAEPLYRAGDMDACLRMARRADAWALRSEWQLAEALMPDWPRPTSCPPMDCGAADIQVAWLPLMLDGGWGRNRLTTGSLDTEDLLARWSFGRRLADRVSSELMFASRGAFQGTGALRARSTSLADDPLPGGYEGTVIQIQSPAVRLDAGTAVRIDCMIRTLGFGRPHQGVLVYDTIGGQEMGVLIRGRPDWTPVRLYRQCVADQQVQVMFELIGAGEVAIDEVQLRIWEPEMPRGPLPLRPIASRPAESEPAESTRR